MIKLGKENVKIRNLTNSFRILRLPSAHLPEWEAGNHKVEHNVKRHRPQCCGDASAQPAQCD